MNDKELRTYFTILNRLHVDALILLTFKHFLAKIGAAERPNTNLKIWTFELYLRIYKFQFIKSLSNMTKVHVKTAEKNFWT